MLNPLSTQTKLADRSGGNAHWHDVHDVLLQLPAQRVKQPPLKQCWFSEQSSSMLQLSVPRQIGLQTPSAPHVSSFDPAKMQDAPVIGCKWQPVSGLQVAVLH